MLDSINQFFYNTEDNTVFKVRTVKDANGEIWFVAKDVCEVLELADPSMTCSRLDEDEKLVQKLFVSGQNRDVLTINESGLYSLIFTSNKPEARRFRKWVTSEVLPALREKGSYSLTNEDDENEDEEHKLKLSISRGKIRAAKMILEAKGLSGDELAEKLDEVYKHYTGESILEIVGLKKEPEFAAFSLPPEGWVPPTRIALK